MRIRFAIIGISHDRRNTAQLAASRAVEQARADQALEQLWRNRVQANISARLTRRVEQILQTKEK